jgi:hypothetical protein
MFNLGEAERRVSILGYADGCASLNAEGTAQGMRVVSVDPLYEVRAEEIRARVAGHCDATVLDTFLSDYDSGIAQGRYVTGNADALPFPDGSFDLALCSHFLFLSSAQHGLAFHLQAIRELTRIAEEVRIFPLLEEGGTESRHLKAVLLATQRSGLRCERVAVSTGFAHGGNEMLRIMR